MSRTKPTQTQAVAVMLPCSYCGAEPDEWCYVARHFDGTPYGDSELAPWADWLHSARVRPVDDLWRYGYLSGVVEGLDEAIAECKRPNRWTVTLERIVQNRAAWAKWLAEYDN